MPVQRPRPPIIVGGTGKKRTPAIAARYADEFNLQTTRRRTPVPEDWLKTTDVAAQIERVRTAAEALGRDRAGITFSMSAALGVGRTSAEAADRLDARHYGDQTFDGAAFHGSPAQVVDQFGPYVEMGIDRVYVRAPIRLQTLHPPADPGRQLRTVLRRSSPPTGLRAGLTNGSQAGSHGL